MGINVLLARLSIPPTTVVRVAPSAPPDSPRKSRIVCILKLAAIWHSSGSGRFGQLRNNLPNLMDVWGIGVGGRHNCDESKTQIALFQKKILDLF